MFDELLRLVGVQGIVRFKPHPSFSAPHFSTFVYTKDAVVASQMIQGFGLWDIFPFTKAIGTEPAAIDQIVPWLSCKLYPFHRSARSSLEVDGEFPDEINSWEKLRSLVLQAPSCDAPVCDGVTYFHYLQDHGTEKQVAWSNPCDKDHPTQRMLITAYAKLLARANLTCKLVEDAYGLGSHEWDEDLPEQPPCDFSEDEMDHDWRTGRKRRKPWQRLR